MARSALASPLPAPMPSGGHSRRGAPRRTTSAGIRSGGGNAPLLELMGGLIPQQGKTITNLLPMPDYRGFTYQGEQHDPTASNPGVAAQAAAFQMQREVVGPASVEHATILDRLANHTIDNFGAENQVIAPSRDPYATPVAVAASPGYIPSPAKRPDTYTPARQKALVYPGAWNPYSMTVRAPTLDDVRQFLNAGPRPIRGAAGRL